jgi:hypothetical protein
MKVTRAGRPSAFSAAKRRSIRDGDSFGSFSAAGMGVQGSISEAGLAVRKRTPRL